MRKNIGIFRGQHIKNGEKVNLKGEKLPGVWKYGALFPGTGDFSIIYDFNNEGKWLVYSDTVGECFTVFDSSNKSANYYEGDICEIAGEDGLFVVEWDEREARVCLSGQDLVVDFSNYYNYEVEVVGNIYDNPELISQIYTEEI